MSASSCVSRTNVMRVLQQHCLSLCIHAYTRSQENRKENEHVENLVFVIAALSFARQTRGVVHTTVGLPHETQNFVVVERCAAAVRLM